MTLIYGFNLPMLFTVTVTGGIGQIDEKVIDGKGMSIGVVAPSAAAKYDLQVEDSEGFIRVYGEGMTGNTTIENSVRYYGQHTFKIANATEDGDYQIKVWLQ